MSWIEGQIIGVPTYSPSENAPVVFLNSIYDPDPNFPEGQWIPVEIPNIPIDAKAVHLSGIMIITYGSSDLSETADMTLRLRRYLGSQNGYNPDYIGQVCEARLGGVRSTFSAWCPLADNKFEIKWTRNTPYAWPNHASYGLKLFADAYMR